MTKGSREDRNVCNADEDVEGVAAIDQHGHGAS